jgi:UrcA family protein
MLTTVSTKLAVAAAFIAAWTAAVDAKAADPATTESRIVRFTDLDLTTADGAAELDRRIAHAARTVCPVEGRSVADHARADACRAKALGDAKAQASIAVATARSGARLAMNGAAGKAIQLPSQ